MSRKLSLPWGNVVRGLKEELSDGTLTYSEVFECLTRYVDNQEELIAMRFDIDDFSEIFHNREQVCPNCDTVAKGERIAQVFGVRKSNGKVYPQSWCKPCRRSKHKVFVYGTLRKHEGNHGFLRDSKYLGLGKVYGKMFGKHRPFPYVALSGDGLVVGEVYEVTDEVLRNLDGLEGYPNHYDRSMVDVYIDDSVVLTAWIYHREDVLGQDDFDVVESGNWKKVTTLMGGG